MESKVENLGKIEPKGLGVENTQLISLLVSSITSEVYQKIEEKESRARNIFFGASSIVFAIVVSIGGFLINQVLDVAIDKKLAQSQKEVLGKSIFAVEVAALDIEARALRESNSFDKETAESIIRKIDRLYKEGILSEQDSKTINENIERLTYSVSSSILSFGQANRIDFILDLERKAELVALESDEVPLVMAISLGDMLLQDPKAPRSWNSDGLLNGEYQKFLTYLKRTKDRGYPEIYILYELLMNQSKGLPDSDSAPFLIELDALSASDQNNFKKRFQLIIDSDRNPSEMRQKEIALQVMRKYSKKSSVLGELLNSDNSDTGN